MFIDLHKNGSFFPAKTFCGLTDFSKAKSELERKC